MTNAFQRTLRQHGLSPIRRGAVETVQVNLGRRCNQACRHCHVDASPTRTEAASDSVIARILWLLERSPSTRIVDITGGAPELHPAFKELVRSARGMDLHVIDRCNLTILSEPGQEDTAEFLAAHSVEVVASLPCYGSDNVDQQRGNGVFEASIAGLRQLNRLGYGQPDSPLTLNLVYNPLGPALPPDQEGLQSAYKARLMEDFGVRFNSLYTITNMPISRFRRDLVRHGQLDTYTELLENAFNPAAVSGVMCRGMLSVGYDGRLFDCDFNQMLDMDVGRDIWEIDSLCENVPTGIRTDSHCLGCTAGAGSSCGGALQ